MTHHTNSGPYTNGSSSNGKSLDHPWKKDGEASTSGSNGHSAQSDPSLSSPQEDYAGITTFTPLFADSSIDRREVVKLTLQTLREIGYDSAAKALEAESGVILEHPSITAFRSAVLTGDWKNAESLLIDGLTYAARRIHSLRPTTTAFTRSSSVNLDPSSDLFEPVLRRPGSANLDSIRFLLQRQRYLELLEARQTKKALFILREKLTPLSPDTSQLHLLSSLVVSATREELRSRAGWDGAAGESRRLLLVDIEAAVSPHVMLPSRRLPQLLEQAQKYQKQQDPFFNHPPGAHFSLLTDHQSDRSVFPSHVSRVLKDHTDEVWCLAFSHDGTKLASGGADKTVLIWSVQDDYKLVDKFVPLTDNISSVSWSPDDKQLLVTSDVDVTLCNLENGSMHTFLEHAYTVATAAWLPDGKQFVTGGMDGKINFWEVGGLTTYQHVTSPFRVLSVAVSPDGAHLVALSQRQVTSNPSAATSGTRGASNSTTITSNASDNLTDTSSQTSSSTAFLMAERHERSPPADLAGGSRTMGNEKNRIQFLNARTHEEVGSVYLREEVVSLAISKDSQYALVNVRPSELQIWDIARQCLVRRFNGHRLSKHVIGCGFGGIDENFVLSGSEDGKIYIWHRATGRLIETLTGHEGGSVNAVAWHPKDPLTIASCGDDHTLCIWGPGGQRTSGPVVKHEAHSALDDSEPSGAANPFPWDSSDSPSVPEDELMRSAHDRLEMPASSPDV